jgi:hypothetical protein
MTVQDVKKLAVEVAQDMYFFSTQAHKQAGVYLGKSIPAELVIGLMDIVVFFFASRIQAGIEIGRNGAKTIVCFEAAIEEHFNNNDARALEKAKLGAKHALMTAANVANFIVLKNPIVALVEGTLFALNNSPRMNHYVIEPILGKAPSLRFSPVKPQPFQAEDNLEPEVLPAQDAAPAV